MTLTADELLELLADSGVPPRYRECRFDNFNAYTESLRRKFGQITQNAYESSPRGLFLFGPPGTGKTHIAVSVMAQFLLRGPRGKFIRAIDYTLHVQRAFGDPGEIVSEMLELYQFVVLDDLGAQKATESASQALFHLIDEFYASKKRLIITSNVTPADLYREEPRIMSRLAEMCILVEMNEKDFRMRKAKQIHIAGKTAANARY